MLGMYLNVVAMLQHKKIEFCACVINYIVKELQEIIRDTAKYDIKNGAVSITKTTIHEEPRYYKITVHKVLGGMMIDINELTETGYITEINEHDKNHNHLPDVEGLQNKALERLLASAGIKTQDNG